MRFYILFCDVPLHMIIRYVMFTVQFGSFIANVILFMIIRDHYVNEILVCLALFNPYDVP